MSGTVSVSRLSTAFVWYSSAPFNKAGDSSSAAFALADCFKTAPSDTTGVRSRHSVQPAEAKASVNRAAACCDTARMCAVFSEVIGLRESVHLLGSLLKSYQSHHVLVVVQFAAACMGVCPPSDSLRSSEERVTCFWLLWPLEQPMQRRGAETCHSVRVPTETSTNSVLSSGLKEFGDSVAPFLARARRPWLDACPRYGLRICCQCCNFALPRSWWDPRPANLVI